MRVAVIDDYQNVALKSADWSRLDAEVRVFHEPWRDQDHIVEALADFDIISLVRERTPFPASLIERLPRLKLISMTGHRTTTLDIAACTRRGILVSFTTSPDSEAAGELAVGLMLACSRAIPAADRNMRDGAFQEGLPIGLPMAGRRVGIVGLGKLGSRVAGICKAFDMDVVAWSPNLTADRAAAKGVRLVSKSELFSTSDIVSMHLALSDSTRGIVGADELSSMKEGSILINTARGPLVDEAALLAALSAGRIHAGLDVYNVEPLPKDHLLRGLPNVVLTPHLGYVVDEVFSYYFKASLANIAAFLDGKPVNLMNPEAKAG
ncbi:MAG: D-2-hydroxyacid dehydrogenase family protein [Rhizobiaceae bacterium]|nr:D-2-hydroxyacid dehydrogenase family protein [Rhizobiaceae bacterium]